MKNFNDYKKDTSLRQEPTKEQCSAAKSLTEKALSAFNGQAGITVLAQIVAEAERSKRAGTLSNQDLDEFYAQFAPMLGKEQEKILQSVINRLKKIE